MGQYYYLAASLPPLEFNQHPKVCFANLRDSFAINLSSKDMKKVESLRMLIDLLNIELILQEMEIAPQGNLEEKELEEVLVGQTFFPEYVFDFLDSYENLKEKITHFPKLLSQFFREEKEKNDRFLGEYFTFEREWRLVLLAFRSCKLKKDLAQQLQFEDGKDPFVMKILVQKDAETYEPPLEYKDLIEILENCKNDPYLQNKALAEYRFRKISEMDTGGLFSIDFILSYLARLLILEGYLELSAEQAARILDRFKRRERA